MLCSAYTRHASAGFLTFADAEALACCLEKTKKFKATLEILCLVEITPQTHVFGGVVGFFFNVLFTLRGLKRLKR